MADYLRRDPFFYRMVETVLSRDKNWVRWKIANCPSISRKQLSPEDFVTAKATAKKITTNKRLRPTPLGSLDLSFLKESNIQRGLDRMKDPERYKTPGLESFRRGIELDDMDAEMANNDEEKARAAEAKASKCWRALRLNIPGRLSKFDRIERSDDIGVVFADTKRDGLEAEADVETESGLDAEEDNTQRQVEEDTEMGSQELPGSLNQRMIVLGGPNRQINRRLIDELYTRHTKIFRRSIPHTTREPTVDEVEGVNYHFVTKEAFSMLRDGDQLLAHTELDGDNYGTSVKEVEISQNTGKVLLLELDINVSTCCVIKQHCY